MKRLKLSFCFLFVILGALGVFIHTDIKQKETKNNTETIVKHALDVMDKTSYAMMIDARSVKYRWKKEPVEYLVKGTLKVFRNLSAAGDFEIKRPQDCNLSLYYERYRKKNMIFAKKKAWRMEVRKEPFHLTAKELLNMIDNRKAKLKCLKNGYIIKTKINDLKHIELLKEYYKIIGDRKGTDWLKKYPSSSFVLSLDKKYHLSNIQLAFGSSIVTRNQPNNWVAIWRVKIEDYGKIKKEETIPVVEARQADDMNAQTIEQVLMQ